MLVQFLQSLNLAKDYDPRKIIENRRISNKALLRLTRGNGYPDFIDEFLEEKGPKEDYLRTTQWARAILEYRTGREYKVAWRFTSTKRLIFKTVFDFYIWQQERARIEKEKTNGTRR